MVPDAFNRFAHRAELQRPHPRISTALEKDFSGGRREDFQVEPEDFTKSKKSVWTDPEGKSFLNWKRSRVLS